MKLQLKAISKEAIPRALEKAELYRYLNEPAEAESICLDILAAEPEHQGAIRLLGLSITDQFTGRETDRFKDAESTFQKLKDPYEKLYCMGLLREREAKAELRAKIPPPRVVALLEDALKHYAEAQKIHPLGNDESILRWNRVVRLIQSRPEFEWNLRHHKK